MKFIQKTSILDSKIEESLQCERDIKNDFYSMQSNAYFCANCGEIWARIERNSLERDFKWDLVHTECLECAEKRKSKEILNVPGSLWNPFLDNRQLEYLPVEALRRELNILLNLEDRKND